MKLNKITGFLSLFLTLSAFGQSTNLPNLGGGCPSTGCTFTGEVILNPATQINPNDAATIGQLQSFVSGLAWKSPPVQASSTTDEALTGTPFVTDGITVTAGQSVLIQFQTDNKQNGIYVVSAGAWSRRTDADSPSELTAATVVVLGGTLYGNKAFTQITDTPTIGSSPIIFTQIGGSVYLADDSTLELDGNIFKVKDGGIFDLEISSSAAITRSKIAAGTAQVVVVNDAAGLISSSAISTDDLSTLNNMFNSYGLLTDNFDYIYSQLGLSNWGAIGGTLSNQTDLQSALDLKENLANKSNNTSLGTSSTLYPTQNAAKVYVDGRISSLSSVYVNQGISVTGTATEIDGGGTLNVSRVLSLHQVNALTFGAAVMGCQVDEFGRSTSCTDASGAFHGIFPILYDSGTRNISLGLTGVVAGTYPAANVTVNSNGLIDSITSTTATSPINLSGGVISIDQASAVRPGYLSSADWITFNSKEDSANKSTNTALGTSNVLFPTQNAVKTYVDNQIVSNGTNYFYGVGSDGTVSCSSGNTTLTRDMYYDNLTISGTCNIDEHGFRIFVKTNLDISAAPAGAIRSDGAVGLSALGAGGSGQTTSVPSSTVGGQGQGITGIAGGIAGNNVGVQATAGTVLAMANGGASGASGAGGASASGAAGGASRAGVTQTATLANRYLIDANLLFGNVMIFGGEGGVGGGSGAGTSTPASNPGRGSGQGGNGGGVAFIAAKNIIKGASTAACAISARGGQGGTNTSIPPAGVGGSGGGSGAGGGWAWVAYQSLTGATATNAICVDGGAGGAGSNGGASGGVGGTGAQGGGFGRITTLNTSSMSGSESTSGTAPTFGSAPSGATGGAGGNGGINRVSL